MRQDICELAQKEAVMHMIIKGDIQIFIDEGIGIEYFPSCREAAEYLFSFYKEYGVGPNQAEFVGRFPEWGDIKKHYCIYANIESLITELKESYLAFNHRDMLSYAVEDKVFDKKMLVEFGTKCAAYANLVQEAFGTVKNRDISKEMGDYFQKRMEDKFACYYSTGFDIMNDTFNGGWDKDLDYVVVAGRPGTGKSTLLINFAYHSAIEGRKVLFYAGEMSYIDIWNRIACIDKNIKFSDIMTGNHDIKELYDDFRNNRMKNLDITVITQEDFGKENPTAYQIEAIAKKGNYDIVYIDQQSWMTDETWNGSKKDFEIAKAISRQIKASRDRLNIPFITAVQMNRSDAKKGVVDLTQLSGSDGIGQDATKVIMLDRVVEGDVETINAHIVKNRSGRFGNAIPLEPHLDKCQFKEVF